MMTKSKSKYEKSRTSLLWYDLISCSIFAGWECTGFCGVPGKFECGPLTMTAVFVGSRIFVKLHLVLASSNNYNIVIMIVIFIVCEEGEVCAPNFVA